MEKSCFKDKKSAKAPNGEYSRLYDTLNMISSINANKYYSYFKTDGFKEIFGDYTELHKDSSKVASLNKQVFQGRLDENLEPLLEFDENFNSFYFLDLYNNKVFFPLAVSKLENLFTSEQINDISQAISDAFISNFEFDKESLEFYNPSNLNLEEFVEDYLDSFDLSNSKLLRFKKMVLSKNIDTSKDIYLEEWVTKVDQQLRKSKIKRYTKEEIIREIEENQPKGEIVRKDSFETDFKDNVNNNIKLMLSLVPSDKLNSIGLPTFIPFAEVYTNLLEKFSEVIPVDSENKFNLLVDELTKLVKLKPEYRHLVEETEENNYFPLFNKKRDINLQRQIVNAFDLVKKNHLQSEIEHTKEGLTHTFKNISEVSNRKNLLLNEWDSNFKNKDLSSTDIATLRKGFIDPLITEVNRNRESYKRHEKFINDISPKVEKIFEKLGIEFQKNSLSYFLNNNSLDNNTIDSRINKLVSLLNSFDYFLTKGKEEGFRNQSNIVKLAEAYAFFMERTSDASVQTMGKQKWVYGNRTYIETQINSWKQNPQELENKLENQGGVESGSFYINYLLGYVSKNNIPENYRNKEERLKESRKRLDELKVYYFNGIQEKGNLENSDDSKAITRKDIILDNINKTLSFKTGIKSSSRTSLASDKSSSIEIQYDMSIDTGFKRIGRNNEMSFSKQTIDTLFNYLNAEYRRINRVYKEIENLPEEELIANLHTKKENGLKFFYLEGLNHPEESDIDLFDKETDEPLYEDLENSPELRNAIERYIEKSIAKEINKAKQTLLDNGVIKYNTSGELVNKNINKSIYKYYVKEKGSNALEAMLSDFVVNSYISQVEYHNLFSGDIANYKDPVDYIKRVSSTYTDGQYLSNYAERPYYNVAIIDEVAIDPVNLDKIKNAAIRKLYKGTNSADGQAWITPDRWKFIKQGLGKWVDGIDNEIYRKMKLDNPNFTKSELTRLAQPLKGVHFELKDGVTPIYLKYSQAVLVPSVIKNIPELKALYDRMTSESDPIDELLTIDAIKTGVRGVTKIHTPEGKVENLDNLNTFQLQNKFWKLQQDLPTKGYKDLAIGSQIKEIMLQALNNVKKNSKFYIKNEEKSISVEEMFDIFNTVLSEKSNLGLNKVKNLLGINEDFEIENIDILYDSILDQLSSREVDQNTIDGLKMRLSPYGLSGKAEIFQNVFSTLLNKKIVDIETNGGSFIQMSDFGFSFKDLQENNEKNGIVLTHKGKEAMMNGESRLHMPEVITDPTTGRKRIRPGGVFIPGSIIAKFIPDYRKYTTDQLFGTLNEETGKYENGIVDSEILENIISYRIPNQGLASNDPLEVLGILPESMADTIVPYTGFTTKTGSDFDIDKLYIMMPSFATSYTARKEKKLKRALRRNLNLEDVRKELLQQGYTKEALKNKNNVYDYFFEDILINNRRLHSEDLANAVVTEIEYLQKNDSSGIKLQYIEPLTLEQLENNDTNFTNYEEKLNNLLINTFHSMLTNKDVYDALINPIDVPFIKDNLSILAPNKERDNMGYYSTLEDAYTREEYMQGKQTLGIIINQLMDSIRGTFSSSTVSDLPVGNSMMDRQKSDKLSEGDIEYYLEFFNSKAKKLNKETDAGIDLLTLEDVKKLRNASLEDSFTALINAAVDIAKDPYLFRGNWNTTTANMGLMLLRKGVHPFKINKFLTSPYIKEYVDFISMSESVTNPSKGNTFIKFLTKRAIEEAGKEKNTIQVKGEQFDITQLLLDMFVEDSPLRSLDQPETKALPQVFKFINKNISKIKDEMKGNETYDNNSLAFKEALKERIFDIYRDIIRTHKAYSKKPIQKNNVRESLELQSESDFTRDIYAFDYLLDLGDKLSLNVKSNSYRVNGKGKNILSTVVAKNLVMKAFNKTKYFNNFSNYADRFKRNNSKYSNNLRTVYDNSVQFPLQVMKNNPTLFVAANDSAIKTFNFISHLSSDNGVLTNQKLADKLERSYYAYVLSGFKPFVEENTSEFLRSFTEKFRNIKKNEKFKNNKLIKELNIVDGVIQTTGTKKLTFAHNDLVSAWNYIDKVDPEFSEQLAKYSYITSGMFTQPTSFFQYIPASFYNRNYFNTYLSKTVKDLASTNSIDFRFVKQFAEHNFKDPMLAGKEKLVYTLDNEKYLGYDSKHLKLNERLKEINEDSYIKSYDYNILEKVNPEIPDFFNNQSGNDSAYLADQSLKDVFELEQYDRNADYSQQFADNLESEESESNPELANEEVQDLSGNTYSVNESDITTYETEVGPIRYITNENGDLVMISDKNTDAVQNKIESDSQETFNKELAQKIQDKLQELYPEIELNITNNPTWEQGGNIFNQQKDLESAVNFRLKVVDTLLKLATPQEDKRTRKYGEKNKPERLTIRLNTKNRPNLEHNLRKTLNNKGVTNQQIDFVFDYMKSNNIQEISTEELALQLASNYSFVVEVNTAKTKGNENYSNGYYVSEKNDKYYVVNQGNNFNEKFDTWEEANELAKEKNSSINNTQHYSNLTVPGGANYTENEIATPAIIPSIKGHAQFSTDNGIGWFRGDDKVILNTTIEKVDDVPVDSFFFNAPADHGGDLIEYYKEGNQWYVRNGVDKDPLKEEWVIENYLISKEVSAQSTPTKTRRILEVQSDLFQKGRDKDKLITVIDIKSKIDEINNLDLSEKTLEKITSEGRIAAQVNGVLNPDLTYRGEKIKSLGYYNNTFRFLWGDYGNNGIEYINRQEYLDLVEKERIYLEASLEKEEAKLKQNQFLQLLNKKNNWVTFFTESIIQDSAKKGYEKVLFPKGETAAKIEGHQTLEEFKKQKEDRIEWLEKNRKPKTWIVSEKDDEFGALDEEFNSKKEAQNFIDSAKNKNNLELREVFRDTDREINQLKQELADVESGQIQLSSIAGFYENTVTNILKKNGYNPVEITDEYGNKWNEISINQARDLSNILLQKNEASRIIGQANIKAGTVLIDAINQKQDTLPHEYAHHYIAWFRNTPLVQEAIKKWGSEEALVQSIGEQVVKQKGEAYNWWNSFVKWIMNKFSSLSKLQKEELTQILTDAFLTRQDLSNVGNNELSQMQGQIESDSKKTVKEGVEELFESSPELANEIYEALGFGQENDLKKVSKKIPFNYGNNKELVLNGDKTITSRNFKFIPNLQAGESGLQVIDSIPFKITYHGELKHSEVKDKVGIDYSEGEAFAKTTKGKPTEKATENFIKGVGTKHIYQLQRINNQPTPQQKQQAQQAYSQYLDTIFPDSEVKDIVYHGTNKEFDKFSKEIAKQRTGLHFTTKVGLENSRFNFPKTNKTVLLNIKNPLQVEDLGGNQQWAKDLLLKQGKIEEANKIKGWDIQRQLSPENDGFIYNNEAENEGKDEISYMVFEPEQIHILGGKQDIEGFKNWVDNNLKKAKNTSQGNILERNNNCK